MLLLWKIDRNLSNIILLLYFMYIIFMSTFWNIISFHTIVKLYLLFISVQTAILIKLDNGRFIKTLNRLNIYNYLFISEL